MKKLLFIIGLLFVTSLAWSKDVSFEDLVERGDLYYEKFTDVPYTGNVTGQSQGKILKGKRKGEWKDYWDNGQLYRKNNYKDGKREGAQLSYHKNGQLQSKRNYKDYKAEGEGLQFHDNGQLFIKEYFIKGLAEGERIWFLSNGKWNMTQIMKNGEVMSLTHP